MIAKENTYDYKYIEELWQKNWLSCNDFSPRNLIGEKKVIQVDYLHPAVDFLHIGQARSYIYSDILARYYRLKGYNVLMPIAWDCFGLRPDNETRKGNDPEKYLQHNINGMSNHLIKIGMSLDWQRNMRTNDPLVYKWTQALFVQMYKNQNDVIFQRKNILQNYCNKCQKILTSIEIYENRCIHCYGKSTSISQEHICITLSEKYKVMLLNNSKQWPLKENERLNLNKWVNDFCWIITRYRNYALQMPLIVCPGCGVVAQSIDYLPIDVNMYDSSCVCPKCGAESKYVADKMSNWLCSSWIWIFLLSNNYENPYNSKELDYWKNIDFCIGSKHQNTFYLLYSEIIRLFLNDMGNQIAPLFVERINLGGLMKNKGGKVNMSYKDFNIDPIINQYGADVFRIAIAMIPMDDVDRLWDERNLVGAQSLFNRLKTILRKGMSSQNSNKINEADIEAIEKTIDKIDEAYSRNRLQDVVIALNGLIKYININNLYSISIVKILLILFNPFTPHYTECINSQLPGEIRLSKTTVSNKKQLLHMIVS